MRGCPRKVNACCKTQSCWPPALHWHYLQCCRPPLCLAASLRLSSVGLFGRLEAQTSGGGGGHDQPSYATSDSHTVSTLSPSRLGLDQAIWVRRGFALSLSPSINAEPKKRMWCVNCNHLTLFHPTSSSHTVWTLFHYWLSLDMVRYGMVISY